MPKDQRAIYSDMEIDLLENIAKRLKMSRNSDLNDLDFTTQWQIEKMNDLRRVTEESKAIINGYGKDGLKAAQSDILQVKNNSLDNVDPLYISAIDTGRLNVAILPRNTPALERVTNIYFETAKSQDNLIRTSMLNSSQQIYLNTINQTTLEVITGINTPQVALSKTIRVWANSGMPLIQNKAGNVWSAEGYINTIFRTMVRNVTSDVQFERMNEYDVDLMEISSHANARPLCALYQGTIVSRSGKSKKYRSLRSTSYGQAAGLFGINCRHDFYPYFEGTEKTFEKFNLKETEKNYELSQQQRSLERSVKNAKRQKVIYKANGDIENAQKALKRQKNATKRLNAFIEKTGLTERADRVSIFNIYQ